jgi:hypothetical protein
MLGVARAGRPPRFSRRPPVPLAGIRADLHQRISEEIACITREDADTTGARGCPGPGELLGGETLVCGGVARNYWWDNSA